MASTVAMQASLTVKLAGVVAPVAAATAAPSRPPSSSSSKSAFLAGGELRQAVASSSGRGRVAASRVQRRPVLALSVEAGEEVAAAAEEAASPAAVETAPTAAAADAPADDSAPAGDGASAEKRQGGFKRGPGGAKFQKRTPKTFSVKLADLQPDMQLTGTVKAIQTYGAFVDVGAREDGLVHISQLQAGFVKDVNEVVKIGQEVQCRVLEVDVEKGRLSLSMKDPNEPAPEKRERRETTEQSSNFRVSAPAADGTADAAADSAGADGGEAKRGSGVRQATRGVFEKKERSSAPGDRSDRAPRRSRGPPKEKLDPKTLTADTERSEPYESQIAMALSAVGISREAFPGADIRPVGEEEEVAPAVPEIPTAQKVEVAQAVPEPEVKAEAVAAPEPEVVAPAVPELPTAQKEEVAQAVPEPEVQAEAEPEVKAEAVGQEEEVAPAVPEIPTAQKGEVAQAVPEPEVHTEAEAEPEVKAEAVGQEEEVAPAVPEVSAAAATEANTSAQHEEKVAPAVPEVSSTAVAATEVNASAQQEEEVAPAVPEVSSSAVATTEANASALHTVATRT